MKSDYLLEEEESVEFVLQVPVRAFREKPSFHTCARMGERDKVMVIRPRSIDDWYRPLEAAAKRGECPRCCLMGLPTGAINLVEEDLLDWMQEAKAISPDTNFGLVSDDAKPLYPCGSCPLCQRNPKMVIRESQDMMSDLVARGAVSMDWIKSTFEGMKPRELRMLHAYALESCKSSPNLPIEIQELATAFNVTERTINRWCDKAAKLAPPAFKKLDDLRNSRAERNGRYEVRHN